MSAPFARPPAIQTTDKCELIEAIAECGFVAFESSTHEMPSFSKISSIRCLPGLNPCNAF